MSFSKAVTKSSAIWIASIGATGLVTFGLTKAVGVSPIGNDSAPAQGEGAAIEARPDDQLTVCVDFVEGVTQEETPLDAAAVESLAKAEVEAALITLETQPYWAAGGFTEPSIVDIGCPSPPYPLVAGKVKLTEPTTIPSVSQPSYYRTFVFVMPSLGAVEQVLGRTDVRVTIQEDLCDGPGGMPPCWEVTEGLYVTASELTDGSVSIPRLLEQALGFASRDSGF
jgi:hypothetical protein